MNKNYENIWLLLIDITAPNGKKFNDLIDVEKDNIDNYLGAWVNVLVRAATLKIAAQLATQGLQELGFVLKEIDTIESLEFLVGKSEVTKSVISEADWLLSSKYVFMISDKLFPYI